MASDIDTNDTIETLGQFLLKSRLKKSLDLQEMAEETKISLANLQAIENDDYAKLPSLTFSRGLYTIYAKNLGLDVENILSRFTEESAKALENNSPKPTPSILARQVGSMAERPPAPPTSLFGLIFIIFLILVALACWYYAINPATYISQKLRGLETSSQSEPAESAEIEQTATQTPPAEPDSEAPAATEPVSDQPVVIQKQTGPRYTLEATFPESAEIDISVDDSRNQHLAITSGKKVTWTAEQAIELILPAGSTSTLILNGRPVNLPSPENGKVIVTVPEILFE